MVSPFWYYPWGKRADEMLLTTCVVSRKESIADVIAKTLTIRWNTFKEVARAQMDVEGSPFYACPMDPEVINAMDVFCSSEANVRKGECKLTLHFSFFSIRVR